MMSETMAIKERIRCEELIRDRDLAIEKKKNVAKLRSLQHVDGLAGIQAYMRQYEITYGYPNEFNLDVYFACIESWEGELEEECR